MSKKSYRRRLRREKRLRLMGIGIDYGNDQNPNGETVQTKRYVTRMKGVIRFHAPNGRILSQKKFR